MTGRRVLVFNHFAVPRGQPGGTRHVELFGGLSDWSYVVIAGRLNPISGLPQHRELGFHPVRVVPYRKNGIGRILNWLSYAVTASWAGLTLPRPDVVYASSPHLLAGLAGWLVSAVRGTRFVLEVRDLWPRVLVDMGQTRESALSYRALDWLARFLYRRADAVVVLAPGVREEVIRTGVPAERIAVIPNAADPADFRPRADRETLRHRYGFTRLTAVYAGAHGPANGLGLLLRAALSVADVHLDIVLVGSGVEKEHLVRTAQAQAIPNVRFMDPVSKEEMADILCAADVGLHVLADVPLFRTGVSPNKVFDYLAASLPIVTNSPGVVGELVERSASGLVTEPDALADGLRTMAGYPAVRRQALGAAGLGWIAANQSRSAMSGRLATLLDAVTAAAPVAAERSRLRPSTGGTNPGPR